MKVARVHGGASDRGEPLLARRWQVAPTLADAARAIAQARALLPQRLPREQRELLEVALSEVLTNLVRHGQAPAPIELAWTEWPGLLEIEVRDRGRAIPPERLAAAGEADFDFDPTDFGTLPEGGLGLAIIKTVFDSVDYASAGGANVLLLRKRLPEGPTA